MERTEKLTITRALTGKLVVKLVVTENGKTVNYSVRAYESTLPACIQEAHRGVNRLLKIAQEG